MTTVMAAKVTECGILIPRVLVRMILNTKALDFYRRERRVRKDFMIFLCVLSVLSGEN